MIPRRGSSNNRVSVFKPSNIVNLMHLLAGTSCFSLKGNWSNRNRLFHALVGVMIGTSMIVFSCSNQSGKFALLSWRFLCFAEDGI